MMPIASMRMRPTLAAQVRAMFGTSGFWWDGSDATTITATSGKVSQLADKTGNGNHLTQATDAVRPLTGASLNGVACLDTRPDKFMLPTANPFIYGAREVFVVMWSDRATSSANAFVLTMPGGSTSNTTIGSAKTQFGNSSLLASSLANRTMHHTLIQHSYIGAAGATTQYMNVNGRVTSGATSSGSVSGAKGAFATSTGTTPMNGLFAEMLVFNKELTADQRAIVLAYLAEKWRALTPVRKYHVVLLAGQSNMRGANGPVNRTDDLTDPRIAMLDRTLDPATGIVIEDATGEIILAEHPLSNRWKDTASPPPIDSVGPGMAYAKALLATLPADEGVLLVPCAQGATYCMPTPPLSSDVTWSPTPTGTFSNAPYTDAIARTNRVLAMGHQLHSILWLQGENEAGRPVMSQATYAGYMDAVVDGLRANITGATNIPFIAGQIGQFLDAGTYPNAGNVNAAIADLPNRKAHTAYVSSVGYTAGTDALHYDAASARLIGAAYWTAYGTV